MIQKDPRSGGEVSEMIVMTKEVKRAYYVEYDEEEGRGYAFVAHNAKEAKKMAFSEAQNEGWDVEWINLRPIWNKKAKVNDLSYGRMEDLEGLKRGVYSWIWGVCPNCDVETEQLGFEEGIGFFCEECEEEIRAKMEVKPC